jgi:hypothetical protein
MVFLLPQKGGGTAFCESGRSCYLRPDTLISSSRDNYYFRAESRSAGRIAFKRDASGRHGTETLINSPLQSAPVKRRAKTQAS